MKKAPLLERFWSKVDCSGGPDACWPWLAGKFPQGYGSFSVDNTDVGAHVFAYKTGNVPVPEGMEVCHTCDSRTCCNPGHLFVGTAADNAADKVAKGRHPQGTMKSNAKLTEAEVTLIKREYAEGTDSSRVLAARFGVSHTVIKRIVSGQAWPHVSY